MARSRRWSSTTSRCCRGGIQCRPCRERLNGTPVRAMNAVSVVRSIGLGDAGQVAQAVACRPVRSAAFSSSLSEAVTTMTGTVGACSAIMNRQSSPSAPGMTRSVMMPAGAGGPGWCRFGGAGGANGLHAERPAQQIEGHRFRGDIVDDQDRMGCVRQVVRHRLKRGMVGVKEALTPATEQLFYHRRPTGLAARVFFITHPEVQIDPATAIAEWKLSPLGRSRMAGLTGWADRLGCPAGRQSTALKPTAANGAATTRARRSGRQ